jgi:FtsZ-binding cell division protein ZapB
MSDDQKNMVRMQIKITIKTTVFLNSKQQQLQEVESQLRKANKQLAAEKNKSTSQKKRADKLQGELDKALDSIQLLQIDLACQKTDNNNLIGENIALK